MDGCRPVDISLVLPVERRPDEPDHRADVFPFMLAGLEYGSDFAVNRTACPTSNGCVVDVLRPLRSIEDILTDIRFALLDRQDHGREGGLIELQFQAMILDERIKKRLVDATKIVSGKDREDRLGP